MEVIMKLVQAHFGKVVHKSSLHNDAPICTPKCTTVSTLFEAGKWIAGYVFEGEESQITCKKCKAKIEKYRILRGEK
jgi:hypothetical protein